MAKYVALILAITLALVASEEQPGAIDAKVQIVPDIAAYRKANPGIELTPLETTKSARQQIVYTLGNRISGDRLVGSSQDYTSWATQQDVQLTLRYPQAGTGAVVTYLQVVVNQSSNQGRGYVVSGGIGQRSIQVVIEAYGTNYFQHNTQIYGY